MKLQTDAQATRDDKMLTALANAQARIWIRFAVRVVVVAIASAFLTHQVPFFAANRPLVDAASGIVVLWPLWTQLGRNYAARIAEGKRQMEQNRWESACQVLAPFAAPPVSRLFDTSGEGTYYLACVLAQEGKNTEARALHAQNARPTEWGRKSADALQGKSASVEAAP